jgi:hypothetical protein
LYKYSVACDNRRKIIPFVFYAAVSESASTKGMITAMNGLFAMLKHNSRATMSAQKALQRTV